METKHTPGPWRVLEIAPGPRGRAGSVYVKSDKHGTIASIMLRNNAALIAAAPDMYEALRACAAFVETFTGDGVQEQPPTSYIGTGGEYVPAEEFANAARVALAKAEGRA